MLRCKVDLKKRTKANCSRFLSAAIAMLLFFLVLPMPSQAAQRGITAHGSGHALNNRRIALVIGNAYYDKGRLRNPVRDARSMAKALREVGFEVITGENLGYREMRRKVIQFGREIDKGGVGLFYYAGHGVQVDGSNYLIPVGARIKHEEEVTVEAVALNTIMSRMAGAKNHLNIIILDACRDNPYERGFRSSGSQGLAQVVAPKGTFIAYATAPGRTADDGSGANSPYTSSLVDHLARPGLSLERLMKEVGRDVDRKTGGQQRPWMASDYYGDFYFKPDQTSVRKPQQPIQLADSPGPKLGEVDQRKLKIQQLLKQAEVDLTANRLTSPKGNNAYEKYRQVLELNPMNSEANTGLKQIVGKYVELAEGRIRAEDFGKAEQYLSRAEKVSEGDKRVLAARDELLKARARSKKTEEASQEKADKQARAEAARKERDLKEVERRLKGLKESAREVERSSDGRFSKDSSGVITDSRTGLQWYVGPDRNTNWYKAKEWVGGLSVAGGGWRMPSRSELRGLYQKGKGSRNMDPIFKTTGSWVWTGETRGSSDAWGFGFFVGREYWGGRDFDYYSRAFAVRSRR